MEAWMFDNHSSTDYQHRQQPIRDLRTAAPLSEVRVYDKNHKLLRIETPESWEDFIKRTKGHGLY